MDLFFDPMVNIVWNWFSAPVLLVGDNEGTSDMWSTCSILLQTFSLGIFAVPGLTNSIMLLFEKHNLDTVGVSTELDLRIDKLGSCRRAGLNLQNFTSLG